MALADIADQVGSPVYVYSSAMLRRQYRVFAMALASACPSVESLICYSVKANSNLAIIRTLARMGAGVDVVSEGELRRGLAACGYADRNRFLRRVQPPVHRHDLRALTCEQQRRGPPVADRRCVSRRLSRADNDCDFPLQTIPHDALPFCVW